MGTEVGIPVGVDVGFPVGTEVGLPVGTAVGGSVLEGAEVGCNSVSHRYT